MQKTLLEEEKIEGTIRAITNDAFTVLDFMAAFKRKYPVDWEKLVEKFGQFGSSRRYKVTTYLSNRLDVYSQKPYGTFCVMLNGKVLGYRHVKKLLLDSVSKAQSKIGFSTQL